jgi:hypothetical protein
VTVFLLEYAAAAGEPEYYIQQNPILSAMNIYLLSIVNSIYLMS